MPSSRREFMKAAALTGALAVSGRLLEGEAGAATPPIDKDLDGVIEMHVHADPDVRARCIDQLTLTRQCKQNGYRGIMYKCHDFITNDIAYLLRATVPGIEVFGGIALNRNYGDTVNVQAAKMATQVTGHYCRCIWMPTLSAAYQHQCDKLPGPGIPVLDPQGKVLPEVIRVMEICAEANIIFASGHSSPRESLILAKKAREVGVKKFVVTHVNSLIWKMTPDLIKQAVDLGAFVEYCYLPRLWGPGTGNPQFERQSREEFLNYIKIIPERSFISTDLGQRGNPNPIDGMRQCVRELLDDGIPQKAIDQMVRSNPAHLIGLAA